jgi:hypothetical protein
MPTNLRRLKERLESRDEPVSFESGLQVLADRGDPAGPNTGPPNSF